MRKRILALCMALCMMLSMAPAAFAEDNEFTSGNLIYKITDAENNYVEVTKVSNVPENGEITIPATVANGEISYTVVGIGSGAIGSSNAAVTGIQSVSMPMDSEYFTYIGSDAFQNCAEIESLIIPASVKSIGSISKTASGDYDYTISNGLGVFYAMTSLKSVTFADGSNLELLGTNAFHDCTALETLTLPSGIKDIGSTIVTGCTSLDSLTIPSSVQNLSPTVFVGYYANDDETSNCFVQEGGKYKLCDGILYDDISLLNVYEYYEDVTVPEGITTIGDNAFSPYEGNSALKSVTFPDSLTTLGEEAFIACFALEKVNFGNSSLSEIPDYAFAGCTSLKSISVPEGVTSIGEGAFFGCTALESIILPEGLNTIGDYAFALCDEDFENDTPSLNSINIPSSVTSLGVCFLAGVKENGETALIFQGNSLPTFEEDDELSALSAISAANEMNSPTVYYPVGAVENYTDENSALLKAGLVSAPSAEDSEEQAYGLPSSTVVSVVAGNTVEIGQYTLPDGATLTLTSSDNTKVTTVDDTSGQKISVTGIAAGSATVTSEIKKSNITLAKETYSITVTTAPVAVRGIALEKDTLSLREGRTATLTATVTPEDATNKNVVWSSDNEDVATVDQNGVVTAVGRGEATITVTTEDGNKTATCTVTVTKKSSSSSSSSSTTYTVSTVKAEDGKITVSPSKAEKGDTVTITVKPDAGYMLDELVITDKNGNEIDYKAKGDNKFTFKMPASKVEIEATFAPERDKTIVLTLGSVEASVFGTPVINDVAPIARNNRTMLPIRFVAEALGARVDWDQTLQKVTIVRDTLVIEIFLGSDIAYVNGQPVQLDSPAFAENNRTYLPLRFVAENLGATVEWEQAIQTVTITAN